MKLSIIIVSFNTKELLKDCLMSLVTHYQSQFTQNQFEIIVVDNASNDGTQSEIKKRFQGVCLIENRKNLGFAKANNLGVKESKGEIVLFLNPDTKVPENTLSVMTEYLKVNPKVGIATCKVVLADGSIDDASHRGFPTPWRAMTHFIGLSRLFPRSQLFNGYHLGYQNMDTIHEIDSCVGAFLMIKRSVGDKLRWFDEDYFWYGDDLDLCYRAKQAGYQVTDVPTVSITHYKGAASGLKKHSEHLSYADNETKRLATRSRFEVMRIFYHKHYLHLYPKWLTGLVFLGISLKQKFTELGRIH